MNGERALANSLGYACLQSSLAGGVRGALTPSPVFSVFSLIFFSPFHPRAKRSGTAPFFRPLPPFFFRCVFVSMQLNPRVCRGRGTGGWPGSLSPHTPLSLSSLVLVLVMGARKCQCRRWGIRLRADAPNLAAYSSNVKPKMPNSRNFFCVKISRD